MTRKYKLEIIVDESRFLVDNIVEVPVTTTKDMTTFWDTMNEIINQDGDEKTDGQCLDEIIDLLNTYGFYKRRQ